MKLPPALAALLQILVETGTRASSLRVYRMGAAMSFYFLFSAAPLLIILIGIAGLVFDPTWVTTQVLNQIAVLFGAQAATLVASLLANFERPTGAIPALLIGLGTALWGASRVFVELHDALNVIWEVPMPDNLRGGLRDILRQRLLSFGLVIVTGLLLTIGLLIHPLVLAFGSALDWLVPDLINAARALNVALSFGIAAGLLAAIYRFLPNARVAWRDVWLGALLGAALLVLGGLAFRLYLHFAPAFPTIAVAASPLIVLTLLQYAVAVIYAGAILCHVCSRREAARTMEGVLEA